MNQSKFISTAAVLILAAVLPAYGQKDQKENGQEQPQRAPQVKQEQQRPAQQPQQPKPAQQPRQAQPAQQPRQAAPQQSRQQSPQQSPQQKQAHSQQAAAPVQQQAKPSPVRSSVQHSQPAAQQSAQQSAQQARAPQARAPQAQRSPALTTHAQAPQVQRSAAQAQSWQQQRGWVKQGGGWQPHANFQQGRDQRWGSDHRDWTQRGGYGGSYIPQASFGIYFGNAHYFHIGVMPVMYMGYPRFAYSGYSFMLLDPWPGSWQENWYASDDVYIDYSDGYYLHDRRYPGVSLAITVVL